MTSIKKERQPSGSGARTLPLPGSRKSKGNAASGEHAQPQFEGASSRNRRQKRVLSSPETVSSPLQTATKQWKAAFKGYDLLSFNRMSGLSSKEWTEGAVPTRATLEKWMAGIRQDSSFAWLNIKDGCEPRAHLISEQLQLQKVRHAKVFLDDEADQSNPKLGASNAFFKASWHQHVAIGVEYLDENTQTLQIGIIDFTVSDRVLSPAEWLEGVDGHVVTTHLDVMPVTQYGHPSQKGIQKQPFDEYTPFARKRLAELAEQLQRDLKHTTPRRHVKKEGSPSPIDTVQAEPLLDAKGKQIGWVFPEFEYEKASMRGNVFYRRIQESKRPGMQIDLEGRPVSSKA